MKCPKCGDSMQPRHFGPEVTLRRCDGCHGLWCIAEDLGDIADVPLLDVLDTGDARRGALYNRIGNVQCPQCAIPMEQLNIPRQPHILVEVCTRCTGVFFDAGELRDAKHYTLSDVLKAFRHAFPLL